ncbi:MAG: rhodanese-like domain-containing protein [Bacteroidota bacterium]|nr:rhodanese-like domain-containing protein [Bacteroidota bacterium]
MKNARLFLLFLMVAFLASCDNSTAQNPENWTQDQLVQPATLAAQLKEGKDLPLIFCVGPGAIIPHSVDIGMTRDPQNLEKLKSHLKTLPKSTNILIYCGCCPFAHCPNVRPAISLLKEMKFTNYHLLNLPDNIKEDWISKGYPTTYQ